MFETHRDDHGTIEALSVHRLVGEITRVGHTDGEQPAQWCATAVRLLVAATVPADVADPEQWPVWARLGPHLLAVVAHARQLDCELDTAASLLNEYGAYTREAGDPHTSIAYLQQARDLIQHLHGVDHPHTLAAWGNLAASYRQAGHVEEALPIEEWVAEHHD